MSEQDEIRIFRDHTAAFVGQLKRMAAVPAISEHAQRAEQWTAHLLTFLERRCRKCEKPVELGYNTCASCAEDSAP